MKNYLKKIKNIPKRIEREIEAFQYRNGRYAGVLRILNTEESLSYIEKHPISFCLFQKIWPRAIKRCRIS